jgi:Gluconate 2-dehydrogenase subunit 3
MNRRSAIRSFIIVSAGASLLPSCLQKEDGKPTVHLNNIKLSGSQEKLLAALTETILPTTTTPGAAGLSSHAYVLMMMDDCFKKEEQVKFMKGLRQFDEATKKKIGSDFVNAEASQRIELLRALESGKDIPEEVVSFYSAVKGLTIESFTGSKYYLTEVRKYDMVPGRFHGCFPVGDKKI